MRPTVLSAGSPFAPVEARRWQPGTTPSRACGTLPNIGSMTTSVAGSPGGSHDAWLWVRIRYRPHEVRGGGARRHAPVPLACVADALNIRSRPSSARHQLIRPGGYEAARGRLGHLVDRRRMQGSGMPHSHAAGMCDRSPPRRWGGAADRHEWHRSRGGPAPPGPADPHQSRPRRPCRCSRSMSRRPPRAHRDAGRPAPRTPPGTRCVRIAPGRDGMTRHHRRPRGRVGHLGRCDRPLRGDSSRGSKGSQAPLAPPVAIRRRRAPRTST